MSSIKGVNRDESDWVVAQKNAIPQQHIRNGVLLSTISVIVTGLIIAGYVAFPFHDPNLNTIITIGCVGGGAILATMATAIALRCLKYDGIYFYDPTDSEIVKEELRVLGNFDECSKLSSYHLEYLVEAGYISSAAKSKIIDMQKKIDEKNKLERIFSNLWTPEICNLIETEKNYTLDPVSANKVATYKEHTNRLKKQVSELKSQIDEEWKEIESMYKDGHIAVPRYVAGKTLQEKSV